MVIIETAVDSRIVFATSSLSKWYFSAMTNAVTAEGILATITEIAVKSILSPMRTTKSQTKAGKTTSLTAVSTTLRNKW